MESDFSSSSSSSSSSSFSSEVLDTYVAPGIATGTVQAYDWGSCSREPGSKYEVVATRGEDASVEYPGLDSCLAICLIGNRGTLVGGHCVETRGLGFEHDDKTTNLGRILGGMKTLWDTNKRFDEKTTVICFSERNTAWSVTIDSVLSRSEFSKTKRALDTCVKDEIKFNKEDGDSKMAITPCSTPGSRSSTPDSGSSDYSGAAIASGIGNSTPHHFFSEDS